MAKRIPEADLQKIEALVQSHPSGIGVGDIVRALGQDVPRRTLQYRLKYLVDEKRLVKEGEKRGAKYRIPAVQAAPDAVAAESPDNNDSEIPIPISNESAAIRRYVRKPIEARKPVGYDRAFLESYRPNVSAYLSEDERADLRAVGTPTTGEAAAGSYAKQILNRLLIDLTWNSSRLEGNTYSLLDTKRLIAFGATVEGKTRLEAQMILNHKDAIEFLVGSVEEIGFNRHTILNLHGLLANNLLPDPDAAGRLRRIPVGIAKSAFHPLEAPQLIEECFDLVLATATAINDPFEQSLFVMAQLPYLQPFDDVNKRVSRLAANIPFIKTNLIPLSFTDVSTAMYTDAMLGVYERNSVELLKDIFAWAYRRSAARYGAVRQSLGEPDPFRLKHRTGLREIIGDVVRRQLDRSSALSRIATWSREHVEPAEREQFREVAESELLDLHEGNFARYQIRPSEFHAWQKVWTMGTR